MQCSKVRKYLKAFLVLACFVYVFILRESAGAGLAFSHTLRSPIVIFICLAFGGNGNGTDTGTASATLSGKMIRVSL